MAHRAAALAGIAADVVGSDWGGMDGAYRLRCRSKNGFHVLDAANRLAERADVEGAEPGAIFTGRTAEVPNDTLFEQWGLLNTGQSGGLHDLDIDAAEAWDITTGNSNIKVVIIDSGTQLNHPDLNVEPGTDSTSDGPASGQPQNACDNHGTAVAAPSLWGRRTTRPTWASRTTTT